ncbi:MAG: hypothetical protein JW928_03100 [Candidatus Aureabacteria bacterium]|nr:hypothetical protein [Candidatus Auribacterota bacterium]
MKSIINLKIIIPAGLILIICSACHVPLFADAYCPSSGTERHLNIPGIRWKKASSKHFNYVYVKRSHWIRYSKKAEKYYEKIKSDLGATGDITHKCTIYLIPDKTTWNHFLAKTGMRQGTAGFYTGKDIFFLCQKSGLHRDEEKTFAHELCHLIFMNFWENPYCPLWLNEGIACYESGEVRRFSRHMMQGKTKSFLSLKELISLDSYPSHPLKNQQFYRQSEWLIAFLLEKHPRALFHRFLQFLQKTPDDFEKALLSVYGKMYQSLSDFETKYQSFCMKQSKY